ncbi:Hvo_1808 family surface protein [Haloarcula sp. 1CSR25-25]|uniref:Hvo_1808 family surface protein n=1 Tax=Haloarcula sp. 1CSR25-25 TaxID=2862545 RepID=UPI0028939D4A|nr:Hvo_1808 family surface protein [Haloarcula sp. 1CSR25-25]MDT3433609.1 Hvo_1808 family surface protein [Haloarcula sp. 1CSR25-25]
MRRPFALAVLCAVVLLLAGCQAPSSSPETEPGGDALTPSEPATDYGSNDSAPTAPATDRLGYENGYWYNESLSVTTDDGLNETEREAVVARTMARVERIRGLEFKETVPVSVVSRAEYRNSTGGGAGESLRRFDNAKFEALFFVGEGRDSIAVQNSNRGESVLGYYSSQRGEIVIVSDSETPTISRGTLAHELVHALQDQQFGLGSDARTRDQVQGRNGLVEGDAVAVTQTYTDRCGEEWDCIDRPAQSGGGGGDRHFGINFMQYFPYSDGPGLITDLRERGGWRAVDDAYDDYPDGAPEVTYPERYPEWDHETVSLSDRSGGDWERVRPSTDRDRPDYAVVGPSAIAGSMAYTIADDYNESSVVRTRDVINYEDGSLDSDDPYNYDLPATDGWQGGRMHVYDDGDETAYVWKTVWASEADAREFADAWEAVIAHWGGSKTAAGHWVIEEDSPYTDAVAVRVDGDTVTVVNAPTGDELDEVHDA